MIMIRSQRLEFFFISKFRWLAQLVERFIYTEEVTSSSLVSLMYYIYFKFMFLSFSSFDFYGSICLCFIFLSLIGLLINRLNILISLICIELMFYGANISLIIFSSILDDQFGSVATLFIVTVAASESAIALALLVRFFRGFNDIFLEEL